MRAAWSSLKNELYQSGLVQQSPLIQARLRELETKLITMPGHRDVRMAVKLIGIVATAHTSLVQASSARIGKAIDQLAEKLEDVSALPRLGGIPLREDLRQLRQRSARPEPGSPSTDPALTAYLRVEGGGSQDEPGTIAVIWSHLTTVLRTTRELDTNDIREQVRDIALHLSCETPDVPTLQYMARKLYLMLRSKIDLGEHIVVSFLLSQLLGAIEYLPDLIPSPFRVPLAQPRAAHPDRPRSASTPARAKGAALPREMQAWRQLRKVLKLDTGIASAAASKLSRMFALASQRPLDQRWTALAAARLALCVALPDGASLDDPQYRKLRDALDAYCSTLRAE